MVLSNIILRWSEHIEHLSIYQSSNNQISGHTLKHVNAGIGL